ncbi:site-2 protease family protein [Methylobacterium isbiliense]|jgi:stage IV sporulation protein FB|uniref:Zinc metalloprotease n=1 Tax=Methylobacterium isbiliense TaxID=315478 RepID=A0ABQ4SDL1_9HYPH|nr:site-2 protease family protein [Methylobacterium isbiliense]MDN3622745.1 site-2 protease family protein [Methylobacterium isbiliense]GJD99858.1 Putative zinc metalloprotease Rip3 [Methylobacterium isbiliense]
MGWSLPLGTVKGTVIRVHITFLLFLAWIGAAAYARGGQESALQSVLYIVLLFLCVLLHEFGHVFAARRYGVRTPDITLLPIGGVARLERIPEDPRQELVIALAGPAVNVAIAAGLFLLLGGLKPGMEVDNPGIGLFERLLWVNLFLVVFNLIPAFPMDGGRVLRAVLAHRLGYARGTQIAAGVGQAVAFGLGLLGLVGGNPLLIFIAFFVYLGAASEAHAVQMRQVSRGLLAGDAMITRFDSLGPNSRVEDAVQGLIATTQHEFPVVDGAGRLRGVLTRDDMIRALRERGPDAPVLEVMRADIPTLRDRQPLEDALRLMQESRLPAVGVTDGFGRLVGLITPENVGEMMMILTASPQGRPPLPGYRPPA